jgi:hypothetical protein
MKVRVSFALYTARLAVNCRCFGCVEQQQAIAQAKAQAVDQLTLLNAVVDSLKQEITKLRDDNKHLRNAEARDSSLTASATKHAFAPPAISHQLQTGQSLLASANDPHEALVRTASRLSALEKAYDEARGRKGECMASLHESCACLQWPIPLIVCVDSEQRHVRDCRTSCAAGPHATSGSTR